MRRLFLSAILSCMAIISYAQERSYFCEVQGRRFSPENELTISIDFGRKLSKEFSA